MGLLLINIDGWGARRGGRTSVTVFAVAFISHRGDSAIAILKKLRHAARALRLRVGGPHLPRLRYVFALVIYICWAMLYVMQLVLYVFVLVIYICQACATSPRW